MLCQHVSSVSELNPQLAPVALKRMADRMTGLWEFPPLRIAEPPFFQTNKVNSAVTLIEHVPTMQKASIERKGVEVEVRYLRYYYLHTKVFLIVVPGLPYLPRYDVPDYGIAGTYLPNSLDPPTPRSAAASPFPSALALGTRL